MEKDCITGLYQCVGVTVGAEFSPEHVSFFYSKVFHANPSAVEVHAAMKKVAGGDSGWSCVGENVLDVLVEMDRERQRSEKLLRGRQLQHVSNPKTPAVEHKPVDPEPQMLDGRRQRKDTNHLNKPHNSDHGRSRSLWIVNSMKRVQRAARQSWVRLATEGVQSLLASSWQSRSQRVGGHTWGWVSLSDILLLVEVKYDVVSHLLYTEMLQEHHAPRVWETLLPWQRQTEVEALEDMAQEALEADDLLLLAELPGALKAYRTCSTNGNECWSAISLLHRIRTCCQEETDTLRALGERLDGESLRLLCLHVRLATLRAKREKSPRGALLAARQSWETWPRVSSPCRAEQAVGWLQREEEEEEDDDDDGDGDGQTRAVLTAASETLLQLLVLTQEQERHNLVQLVHDISLEDLQCPDEGSRASLKNACVHTLRQMAGTLPTLGEAHTTSRLVQGGQETWPRHQLNNGALDLLTHLMELQEAEAAAVLSALKGAQCLQALRDEYESKLGEQHHANLLRLLTPDTTRPSDSVLGPKAGLPHRDDNPAASCCTGPAEGQHVSAGPPEALVPVRPTSRERAAEDTREKDASAGGRMEDLPYLEVLCVSDPVNVSAAEDDEEEIPQICDKQVSLIAVAWSKPPADDTEREGEGSVNAHTQTCDIRAAEHTLCAGTAGGSEAAEIPSGSTGHPDTDLQPGTTELTSGEKVTADQPATLQWDHSSPANNRTGETGGEDVEVPPCPTASHSELLDASEGQRRTSRPTRESSVLEREHAGEPVSAMERERTMRSLVDMQRKVEQRQQRDRETQLLRVQERLSITQNRKAEEDLLGLKHGDRLRHVTGGLPLEDKHQQRTVVRERLEQLRRERSHVMQSKRDRNTAGFKELLGPVSLPGRGTDDTAN